MASRLAAGTPRRLESGPPAGEHVVTWFRLVDGIPANAASSSDRPALAAGCTLAVCTYKRPASVIRFLDSLLAQGPPPEHLVLVDASPDDATEQALWRHPHLGSLARRLDYLRVKGPLAGLTRQRNIALQLAGTDVIAFFDDDVVLLPGCLAAMRQALCGGIDGGIVGVGTVPENERAQPNGLWKMRRALGIVPTLQPGRYTRSGFQIPWWFLAPTDQVVEGDWLHGCASMWRTADARHTGFHEGLDGYANGEDLEFSLRMRRRGKIAVAGAARLLHLQDMSGRPNLLQMGYMGLRNLFHIHQSCRPQPRWIDTAYFLYGYGVDTLVRLILLCRPGDSRARWEFVRGRLRFFRELVVPVL